MGTTTKDNWNYETDGLEQGAYFRNDHAGVKCAVILPLDRQQPIEQGVNANLLTRDFGQKDWQNGVYTIVGAKQEGDNHCYQYARDLAKDVLGKASEDQQMHKLATEERGRS